MEFNTKTNYGLQQLWDRWRAEPQRKTEDICDQSNIFSKESYLESKASKKRFLQDKYDILTNFLIIDCKRQNSSLSKIVVYDFKRLQSVQFYLKGLLNGKGKLESAEEVAAILWDYKKTYLPRCIIKWSKEYCDNSKLQPFRQGRHCKRVSLLDDEDIKEKACRWLRSVQPKNRSPKGLKEQLEETILLEKLGLPVNISLQTVTRFMNFWGFNNRKCGQQIYYDGHERQDVIEYRKEWAARMCNHRNTMVEYEGENMEIALEPARCRVWEKRKVLVTHDECTFYSNDGKDRFWLMNNESVIKKKGQGSSLMVSDFLCPCHGPLRLDEETARRLNLPVAAREIILPGKNRQGWWKSEDMVKQLREKALPIFAALHPNDVGIFVFDQSSNHNAYRLNALVTSRMTLNSKEEKTYKFKDGWFIKDHHRIIQSMFEIKNGQPWFKGIKKVSAHKDIQPT